MVNEGSRTCDVTSCNEPATTCVHVEVQSQEFGTKAKRIEKYYLCVKHGGG